MKKFICIKAIIFLAGLGIVLFYVNHQLEPASKDKEEIKVIIPMGSSPQEIAEILEEKKIIKNSKFFYYYIRFMKESDFQAGTYMLSPHMELNEITNLLKEGRVYKETYHLTIPEGFNVEQIGQRLEEKGITSKEDFIRSVQEDSFDDISIVSEIPEVTERNYRLEGFLFPKTYEIIEGTSVQDIIRMMLRQTEKEIPSEWLEEIKKEDKSLYEIMTLASIVEEEAATKDELAKIAGVYYNRLDGGMLLQADATIQYALPEVKQRVLYSDLEIDSPYNTYKYPGLTPGPIASPGLKAIEATIFPEQHNYKFYVTKKDGSKEHYFSETYNGHLSNIEKSKKN